MAYFGPVAWVSSPLGLRGSRVVVAACLLLSLGAVAVMACVNVVEGVHCSCSNTPPVTASCYCRPGKVNSGYIVIKNLGRALLHPTESFHLTNCTENPVFVEPEAFSGLDQLEDITFHNIQSLTLLSKSIYLSIQLNNISFTFSSISKLSLWDNAVQVHEFGRHFFSYRVRLVHVNVTLLERSAIYGNLSELVMEDVVFTQCPRQRAVHVGREGNTHIIMKSVTASRGLSAKWITGYANHLSILDSTLVLWDQAFSGLELLPSASQLPSIVLFRNDFWDDSTRGSPSLPSQALELGLPLQVTAKASNNRITCRCRDLVWLLEPPLTKLKHRVMASLTCLHSNITSAVSSCKATWHSLAPRPQMCLNLIIMSAVFVYHVV